MIWTSINQLLGPVQYQAQKNRAGASRKAAEAERLPTEPLKAVGSNLEECGKGKWMISTFASLKAIMNVPPSKATHSEGGKWMFAAYWEYHVLPQRGAFNKEREDLRVLIDVIIWPSLASDVRLRPRFPPSVVVLGADDTLPYIIWGWAKA